MTVARYRPPAFAMRGRLLLTLGSCFYCLWTSATCFFHGSANNVEEPQFKIYNEGLTTAVVAHDRDGVIKRCSLYMERKEDSPRKLSDPALQEITASSIDFTDMMALISECQSVDRAASNTNKTASYTIWSFFRGILPGTKWCGVGDIARNWEDLGDNRELDRCCRTHDHCPVRIHAFNSKFGLSNLSLRTKSHCECDKIFYDCLKGQNSTEAAGVGDFYFNIVRGDCITEDSDKICTEEGIRRCGKLQHDKNQPKQYKFTKSKIIWK